jgi:hypothetical protein
MSVQECGDFSVFVAEFFIIEIDVLISSSAELIMPVGVDCVGLEAVVDALAGLGCKLVVLNAEFFVANVFIAARCSVGKMIEFDVIVVLAFVTLVDFCVSDDFCGTFDARSRWFVDIVVIVVEVAHGTIVLVFKYDSLGTAFVQAVFGGLDVELTTVGHNKMFFLLGVGALITSDGTVVAVAIDAVVGGVDVTAVALLYMFFVSASLYVSLTCVRCCELDSVARALAIGHTAFVSA